VNDDTPTAPGATDTPGEPADVRAAWDRLLAADGGRGGKDPDK
jgi:hypothetical protein